MKRALIIGASGGIGAAMCAALEKESWSVVPISRRDDGIDVTSEPSVERCLGALDGAFDLMLVATGALVVEAKQPEKSIDQLNIKGLSDQFLVNAIGPMLVLKHARHLIPRHEKSVFAVLSARVGSIGDNKLGGWYGYRAAKAGLNQLIRSASVEMARTHKDLCCVCLHPGTVKTPFTGDYQDRYPTVSPEVAALRLLKVIGGLSAEDTGRFLDYTGKEIPW